MVDCLCVHVFYYILIDIDECATNPKACSQLCNDTEGSFLCGCKDGYVLNTDKVTCDGKINLCLLL